MRKPFNRHISILIFKKNSSWPPVGDDECEGLLRRVRGAGGTRGEDKVEEAPELLALHP